MVLASGPVGCRSSDLLNRSVRLSAWVLMKLSYCPALPLWQG